jgi:two-component system LytT family response regulator
LDAADSKIEIISVCDTIEEAFTKIKEKLPHLLFLDIQLQENNRAGFDLLQKTGQSTFDVIFTTAHIDNNINEIRRCGIDYLPKPYIQDELQDALRKVWEKRRENVGNGQLDTLRHNLATQEMDEQIVCLKQLKGSVSFKIKNLIYCEARNQYTAMHVWNENEKKIKVIVATIGIGIWEKDFAGLKFCRIHDSCLINVRLIIKVEHKTSTLLLKHVTIPLRMSRTGKERLDAIIKNR